MSCRNINSIAINASTLNGKENSQFYSVTHNSGQTIDCNNISSGNGIYHASSWSNFVSAAKAVMGTLMHFNLAPDWKFQIGLKYDSPTPGAGIFYRIYNGSSGKWTAWTSLSTVSVTSLFDNSKTIDYELDTNMGGVERISLYAYLQKAFSQCLTKSKQKGGLPYELQETGDTECVGITRIWWKPEQYGQPGCLVSSSYGDRNTNRINPRRNLGSKTYPYTGGRKYQTSGNGDSYIRSEVFKSEIQRRLSCLERDGHEVTAARKEVAA